MGEEGAAGGTVRYVDSSLERIEVRVTGLNESRYVVTVNGVPLPLQPTGNAGEFVAGVRYRAWAPPSALHPTIGVACAAHVRHRRHLDEALARRLPVPRGASGRAQLRTFPVNAYEAESRRLARFFRIGHTPGARRRRSDRAGAASSFRSRWTCAAGNRFLNEDRCNLSVQTSLPFEEVASRAKVSPHCARSR